MQARVVSPHVVRMSKVIKTIIEKRTNNLSYEASKLQCDKPNIRSTTEKFMVSKIFTQCLKQKTYTKNAHFEPKSEERRFSFKAENTKIKHQKKFDFIKKKKKENSEKLKMIRFKQNRAKMNTQKK